MTALPACWRCSCASRGPNNIPRRRSRPRPDCTKRLPLPRLKTRALSDWLAWIETLHPRKIELGLERVHAVLDRLKLRRPGYRVITVTGTNGKGSAVAMLEACLCAAGYRVRNLYLAASY